MNSIKHIVQQILILVTAQGELIVELQRQIQEIKDSLKKTK